MELSVVIITYNEEQRLAPTLRAISTLADEIVIVDGGSTDRTKEIACSFPNVVWLERPFDTYGRQKNFGNDHARGKYIFALDADEVLTPMLASEIATEKGIGAPMSMLSHVCQCMLTRKSAAVIGIPISNGASIDVGLPHGATISFMSIYSSRRMYGGMCSAESSCIIVTSQSSNISNGISTTAHLLPGSFLPSISALQWAEHLSVRDCDSSKAWCSSVDTELDGVAGRLQRWVRLFTSSGSCSLLNGGSVTIHSTKVATIELS
jgi:hypothetical protein